MPCLNVTSTMMMLLFHCHYQAPQISKLEGNNECRLGFGGSTYSLQEAYGPVEPLAGLGQQIAFQPLCTAFRFSPFATLASACSRNWGKAGCPGSIGDSVSTCSDGSSSSSLLGELLGM